MEAAPLPALEPLVGPEGDADQVKAVKRQPAANLQAEGAGGQQLRHGEHQTIDAAHHEGATSLGVLLEEHIRIKSVAGLRLGVMAGPGPWGQPLHHPVPPPLLREQVRPGVLRPGRLLYGSKAAAEWHCPHRMELPDGAANTGCSGIRTGTCIWTCIWACI